MVLLTVSSFFCFFTGPYHPGQASGHSLPGLAELSQSHSSHAPPAFGQHPSAPSHSAGHSLPGIGPAMQHPSPQSINRERERDSRERELIERQRQEELAHREREQREREREQLDRQQREQQHHPVQSHTGSIPLHQPVANKVPNSIHGPNGLLSNLGGNPSNGPPPQSSMQSSGGGGGGGSSGGGAGGGPAGIFGPQMRHGEGTPGSFMQHPSGPPAQSMLGFGASGPQIPGNVAALTQGQQPILNVSVHFFFSASEGGVSELGICASRIRVFTVCPVYLVSALIVYSSIVCAYCYSRLVIRLLLHIHCLLSFAFCYSILSFLIVIPYCLFSGYSWACANNKI